MKELNTPIGLQEIGFVKYGESAETTLGNAVLANLSIETNELQLYGDDALQIDQSVFKRGTLTTETLLDSLKLEAALFGSTYSGEDDTGKVVDSVSDISPYVAVYFVQRYLRRTENGEQKEIFRYTVFPRAAALRSSIKQEAKTTGESLDPKNHTVDFSILAADDGQWRERADAATLEAAKEAMLAAAKAAAKAT